MATLKELLAAKQAATVKEQPPKGGTTNHDDLELTEAIDRIDPPGKRQRAASLVLSKSDPEPAPQEAMPETWTEGRALGATKGELIPMAHTSAWDYAMTQLDSQLCVMQDPHDPEACWLALRHGTDCCLSPLLLHRLPWLLYPAKPTTPNEPF